MTIYLNLDSDEVYTEEEVMEWYDRDVAQLIADNPVPQLPTYDEGSKTSSIPAAVLRDVLARPLGRHARSGMPSRPRLTKRNEIRCADPVRPTVPV